MTAFIILLLSCVVLVVGGYLWRRVDWQAIEDENKRYYTSDGSHLYYDRKILRRLREEAEKPQTQKRE
ncbi:hypothetical protein [Alistipes sp.]|uniref:hypothetical protein n=1 Tax=Alistipes sp. TaxID=1872444 RepID=UPI003AF1DD7B